ncbi:hypothetical protein [Pelagovum pacificum]|uniref:Glycoside hydrolase family 38 N-terminal domain-containing protein n=1 Tax=Pelagovum pacificum TaxID=2588711 RepID=A0A5C5GEV5_9RHOB|nr:hypothetical protein [Pelagovum pacificum]QQA43627.1 hypothetical protein I8N54_03355 [Pelagovum pacificum]TNY33238.1 hypothetical protein FHY64_08175 [Pelagovum pacificum]
MAINELLIINHTHTDIGYTDYADTLFRHQRAIIDDALDMVEREQDRPEEARFRWTCEVSAITADWFQNASGKQKARFLDLYEKGLVGAGAMPVHWTPLISPANAIRSLKHLKTLRDEGLDPKIAMQCDVNGLGWFWTDILIDLGVEGFLLEPNPHRGMKYNDMLRVFDWTSPSGRNLFTVHGWHYSVGVNTFFFGNNDMELTQKTLDRVTADLEERRHYPYSKAILPITNNAAPDNGFATQGVSDFVERWNAEGRSPRLRICTVEQAMAGMRESVAEEGNPLPAHAGDWSDFWVDGVGSTSYETVVARTGERLLPVTDLLAGFTATGKTELLDKAADEIQYYDEHTWGAYSSHSSPDSPFTRMQLSWKTHRAHHGFALALEATRTEAIRHVHDVADGKIEGDHILRRVNGKGVRVEGNVFDPGPIEEHSYYVANPSAVARKVTWPVPADHAGSAPQTILDSHSSNYFLTEMQSRGEQVPSKTHVITAELPPYSEAIVKPVAFEPAPGIASGDGWIENDRWRLEVDPKDGSIRSLKDKGTGRECVNPDEAPGKLVYEALKDPSKGRFATFGGNYDWSRMETVIWPETTDYVRRTADSVTIGEVSQDTHALSIEVKLAWSHGDKATIHYRLPHAGEGIEVDSMIHKMPITDPESFYMVFGTTGANAKVGLDVGDRVIDAATQQIPLSCEAWIGIQRFATVATDDSALVIASPDAPLAQPFGIQTENAGSDRKGNDPAVAFWLLNNHWDTNFPITQAGGIPFRFRLLPQAMLDMTEATAFAETATTPPVIVRAYGSSEVTPRTLLDLSGAKDVTARVRRTWDDGGLLVTLVNSGDAGEVTLATPGRSFGTAKLVDPAEAPRADGDLDVSDGKVTVSLPAGGTAYVRLD